MSVGSCATPSSIGRDRPAADRTNGWSSVARSAARPDRRYCRRPVEEDARMTADPNRLILTGENPFLRLSERDGDELTTNASFWRIIFCPAGPGHVLYVKSELTDGRWRIYSDNIAMARWLQTTVQGMLNAELADTSIPVLEASFDRSGDPRYFWTERAVSHDDEVALTWYDIGEPLLIHTQPNTDGRQYGV